MMVPRIMPRNFFNLMVTLLILTATFAQESTEFNWYDLSKVYKHGKVFQKTHNPFQRFPDTMEKVVRPEVWNLSLNPAGVNIKFQTKADQIIIKYKVKGKIAFPHMPATGVSGIDLYLKNKNNKWQWVKGNYHFGDTISYRYQIANSSKKFKEFMLYLPLYVTVEKMHLGVPQSNDVNIQKSESSLPMIIYGTSITQGACSSRPGNAWTNKLSRKTGIPILNFGFSGNGWLEPEILEYLVKQHAQVYILDCLANFDRPSLGPEETYKRLIYSVKKIRAFHPYTPIIFTDHAGYGDAKIYTPRKHAVDRLNKANHEAYDLLLRQGDQNIYLLTQQQIGLQSSDFVDGLHPTDGGMEKYAAAYFKLISEIFN